MMPDTEITITLCNGKIQDITPRAGLRFTVHDYDVDTVQANRQGRPIVENAVGDWYATEVWESQPT